MRILQIVNSVSGGGAEKLAVDLHREYLNMGQESWIIALSGPSDGTFVTSAGFSSPYHPFAAGKAACLLRGTCPEADAVHVHLFPSLLTVPGAVRRAGYRGPLISTEHSTSNRRRGTLRGRLLDRLTYKPYSRIVCISKAVEDALIAWKPKLRGRTCIIPNGVRLERFSSMNRTAFHEPAVILTAGRITAAKNCMKALQSIEILAETSDIPFKWVVAGDGPLLPELRSAAADLVSKGMIEFLGSRDDIPELMSNADIFFMPSLWEGFGIAAVEAMASGLPVVAGNVPGLREVVGSGTGILVEPSSERDQADALELLLRDVSSSLSMGINGQTRAASFSIRECAEKHLELFSELCFRAEG